MRSLPSICSLNLTWHTIRTHLIAESRIYRGFAGVSLMREVSDNISSISHKSRRGVNTLERNVRVSACIRPSGRRLPL